MEEKQKIFPLILLAIIIIGAMIWVKECKPEHMKNNPVKVDSTRVSGK